MRITRGSMGGLARTMQEREMHRANSPSEKEGDSPESSLHGDRWKNSA